MSCYELWLASVRSRDGWPHSRIKMFGALQNVFVALDYEAALHSY